MSSDGLDPNLLMLLGAGAVFIVGVVVVLIRAERSRAELNARIAVMAEAQTNLSQQLASQERAVGERLADVGRRVGESLDKSSERAQKTMTDLRERLARIDAAQKNIAELSTQVVGLQDILSNKQARGAFGEIQLEGIVEKMLPPDAYEFQARIGEDRIVDCLIKLPNPPGPMPIDAKFPLEGYRALGEAKTPEEKTRAERLFSTSVLKHVRDISSKYIVPGETAELAMMFLPSEAIYAELHANFPSVVEQSFRERVFIVSPTTMWAMLNTVRAIFRDVRMRDQANVIQKELHVMLADVARLDKRVDSLDQHFSLARRDIDEIRTSTGKITRRVDRIQELELDDDAEDEAAVDAPAPKRVAND